MKVLAQRGIGGALLMIGAPLRSDLGIVVDLEEGEVFPKWNFNSILLRGYWDVVTATPDEQKEAIRLATIHAKKPLLIDPIPVSRDA